jgi:N-acylneuraminate cytidylyltransferase
MHKPATSLMRFVSTDDSAIKANCFGFWSPRLIDQPYFREILNQPTTLQHGLQSIHDEVENVIVLQPTNPLRPPNLLKIALRNSKTKKSIVCLPLRKTIRNLRN